MLRCVACPLRRRDLFVELTEEEVAFMTALKRGEERLQKGAVALSEGYPSTQVYTVLDGVGTRSKLLPDGQRQVINFVFPGDFIGLQAGVMGEMKHSVEAASAMVLCTFNRADLWKLFNSFPARAFDLTWLAAMEEHFLGETIASLGQRDATERMAWALLRIFKRLRAVSIGRPDAVPFPFRQLDLADALGLSLVHTNKTLTRLREKGLANWAKGWLQIPDTTALAIVAQVSNEAVERRPIM